MVDSHLFDGHEVYLVAVDAGVDATEVVVGVTLDVLSVRLRDILPLVTDEQRRVRAKVLRAVYNHVQQVTQL